MDKKYCPYCMAPVPEGESCSVCGLTSGNYVPSPHHLPPGTVLMDRYLVGRVLGEGGFGITYIGRDMRLELKVAIKEYYPVDRATRNASASLEVTNFIGPSAKSYERGKQKFLGEAQVMAKMDKQQSIVSVRDFFEINNTAYIVMEYIEGITFRELVEKKGGRIPPEELFPMLEPLFHALSTMHENGLIHRDISPDNLMLENGKVRLLDFGCAREASRGVETMTIALKHGYAPIEQYQQKGQGPWTDIYALSATIYYCLTGKVPPQALDRIAEDELLLPGKLGVQLSAEQEKALLKGMKLQPNRRFSSAEEMLGALYGPSAKRSETVPAEDATETIREKNTGEAKAEEPASCGAGPQTPEDETQMPDGTFPEMPKSREQMSDGEYPETSLPDIQELDGISMEESVLSETVSAETDPGETTTGETVPDNEGIRQQKKKRIYWISGIGAACFLTFIFIWGSQSSHSREKSSVEKNVENISGAGNAAAGEHVESRVAIDPDLFDDASTFTGGDRQEFQRLMEDDSVTSIIIACRNMDVKEITITKPVLVAEGADWKPDKLTVSETGYLQVEGCLDMNSGGIMRLLDDKLRVFLTQGGEFRAENAVVWMDHENCLATEKDERLLAHTLVCSENIFEGNQVVSVTDMQSLKNAVESKYAVSIDGDITMTEDVWIDVPVRIAEGVTVHTSATGNTNETFGFSIGEHGIFINNGTVEGNFFANGYAAIVNNGVFTRMPSDGLSSASLWFEDKSTLINRGTMDLDNTSRFWEDSLCINQGTINSYDFFLCGGNMANCGRMALPSRDDVAAFTSFRETALFSIINGSCLWNKEGAEITVLEGAEFINNSHVTNQGDLIIEDEGAFDNAVLENDGNFRIEHGGTSDRNRKGIYFGSGVFDLAGTEDIHVYPTFSDDAGEENTYAEAATAEELEKALENPEVQAVFVRANITMEKDLTMRKDLVIDSGKSLAMAEGTALVNYGGSLVLRESASLYGNQITLSENAEMFMQSDSQLIIEEDGKLTVDGSLVHGTGGNVQLDKAEFVLKNQAGFAFDFLSSLKTSGCKMNVQDASVFVTPHDNGLNIGNAEITLADGYFYAASDSSLKDCRLHISQGIFRNSANVLALHNCMVNIGEEGEWTSECANLSLLSGTTLENRGRLNLSAWHEYNLTIHGAVTNYGDMDMNINHDEPSEPINNQGNIYYSGNHYAPVNNEYYRDSPHDWKTCVIGNAPVDTDTQQ